MNNYIQLGKEQIPISDETADNLRKQFAKKEEMRLGHFGVDGSGKPFVIVHQNSIHPNPKAIFSDGCGQVNVNGPNNDEPNKYDYIILGNIFDMLKDPLPDGRKQIRVDGKYDYWYANRELNDTVFIGTCRLEPDEWEKAVEMAGKMLLLAAWMKQQEAKCKS